MERDVGTKTVAAHGERSRDRLTEQNGYTDRTYETRSTRSSCASQNCACAASFQSYGIIVNVACQASGSGGRSSKCR